MGIRISVRDASTRDKIEMEVEHENTIDEIIESTCSYWNKDPGAYVLRYGKKVLRGATSLADTGVQKGDVLELIPDPEGGI